MGDPTKELLEAVVDAANNKMLKELHTALPAVVTKVDLDLQVIECQPTIKRKLAGNIVNLPLLVDVPLRFFKSTGFSITFPVAVGDFVLVIFSERSIDTWLEYGDIQDPLDIRTHSLSDGFALPIMYPNTEVIESFDSTNLQIRIADGSKAITITPAGIIELNGNTDNAIAFDDMQTAFEELKTEINAFIAVYDAHTHTYNPGPGSSTPSGAPSAPGTDVAADMGGAIVNDVKVT